MVTVLLIAALGSAWAQVPASDPAARSPAADAPAPASATTPTKARDVVRHVPPSRAAAGRDLVVAIGVDDISRFGQVELHFRVLGTTEWKTVVFDRRVDDYAARIPGRRVHAPGVEYFIASRADSGRVRRHFASAEEPWAVYVEEKTDDALRMERLARYDGQRSRFHFHGQGESFGANQVGTPDYQAGFGASYTYRVLSVLHALRFGFQRMRGSSWEDSAPGTSVGAGFDQGYAELHLAASDAFAVRGQVTIGANLERFSGGGELGLRLGRETSTHVWLWYGGVGGVGQGSGLSLHWDTVPRVPMSAGVDVTTWPAQGPWAVRLRYGAEVPLSENFSLTGRVSYQARAAEGGGLGGGAGVAWSF